MLICSLAVFLLSYCVRSRWFTRLSRCVSWRCHLLFHRPFGRIIIIITLPWLTGHGGKSVHAKSISAALIYELFKRRRLPNMSTVCGFPVDCDKFEYQKNKKKNNVCVCRCYCTSTQWPARRTMVWRYFWLFIIFYLVQLWACEKCCGNKRKIRADGTWNWSLKYCDVRKQNVYMKCMRDNHRQSHEWIRQKLLCCTKRSDINWLKLTFEWKKWKILFFNSVSVYFPTKYECFSWLSRICKSNACINACQIHVIHFCFCFCVFACERMQEKVCQVPFIFYLETELTCI